MSGLLLPEGISREVTDLALVGRQIVVMQGRDGWWVDVLTQDDSFSVATRLSTKEDAIGAGLDFCLRHMPHAS
jgi:hypothetical protein